MATKRSPKTRVQASVLHGALKDVLEIVESRSTIPVLSHVLLCVSDQQLTITASDLDHWATRNCATADRDGPDMRCDGDPAGPVRLAGWENDEEAGSLLQVLMPARVR